MCTKSQRLILILKSILLVTSNLLLSQAMYSQSAPTDLRIKIEGGYNHLNWQAPVLTPQSP